MVRKWGQMLKSNGIVRWILKLNDQGNIQIIERNVSKHMPVNRMIEQVGFYSFEFIDVVKHLYLVVFYPHEHDTVKSAIMVGRFDKQGDDMVMADMTDADQVYLDMFYTKYFKTTRH